MKGAKKTNVLLWIAAPLVVCLIAMVCVDYFVLQHPRYDRSSWCTTGAG